MNKTREIKSNYDTIIIGGGAAGITAAISLKNIHPKFSVLIIDQTFALGRKILVSGAGRCNLTNKALEDDDWRHRYYSDLPQILDEVFSQFGYQDIIKYFEELGILTYEELKNNTGKIFPITDSARNVVNILIDELQRLRVETLLETTCTKINKSDNIFEVQTESGNQKKLLTCKYLIVAAGGKTYPALGSNGKGYELLQNLQHSMLKAVPAAGPLLSDDVLCKQLQGTKNTVSAAIYINGKKEKSGYDDVLFTQYGLSGSLIFNLSRAISVLVNRDYQHVKAKIIIDFLPKFSQKDLLKMLSDKWQKRPGQLLSISLLGLLNSKVAEGLCKRIGLNPNTQVKDISHQKLAELVAVMKMCEIDITGTKGWNESEFTAGGIKAAEINPKTLESKLLNNLYLCGEIINVDGDVGGFNLSWAWASGFVAGKLQ